MIVYFRGRIRSAAATAVIFAFLAAGQARASGPEGLSDHSEGAPESCFIGERAVGSSIDEAGAMAFPSLLRAGSAAYADTLETYDIELEEEADGLDYKKIAGYVVAAAFIGYAIYILLDPGEEEEEDDTGGGKDIPFSVISVPLGS